MFAVSKTFIPQKYNVSLTRSLGYLAEFRQKYQLKKQTWTENQIQARTT